MHRFRLRQAAVALFAFPISWNTYVLALVLTAGAVKG
jgi:ABC-type glycerol-3-phosphate transport system permease component